jgi:hypothetical protein
MWNYFWVRNCKVAFIKTSVGTRQLAWYVKTDILLLLAITCSTGYKYSDISYFVHHCKHRRLLNPVMSRGNWRYLFWKLCKLLCALWRYYILIPSVLLCCFCKMYFKMCTRIVCLGMKASFYFPLLFICMFYST